MIYCFQTCIYYLWSLIVAWFWQFIPVYACLLQLLVSAGICRSDFYAALGFMNDLENSNYKIPSRLPTNGVWSLFPNSSKLLITLALLLGGAVLVCRSATTLFSRLVNSDRLGILPNRRTLSLAPWWTPWVFTTGRWFYTYIYIYMIAWFPKNYHVLVISLIGLVAFICASVALLRLDKGNPVLLYGIHLEC